MLTNNSRILGSTALMTLALTGMAVAGPTVTGYVTGSYNKNLNNPVTRASSPLNYYQQTREATFESDAAHITLAGGDSLKATYGIDIDAGTNSASNGGSITGKNWGIEVQQAFVAVPFGSTAFGLKGGKFYTTEGIEVLNSAANPTISRGLLFGQVEPVAHTGAVVTGTFAKFDFAVGGVNGWDSTLSSATDGIPMVLGKVGFNLGAPLVGALTAYYGAYQAHDNLLSIDLTAANHTLALVDLNVQVNYLVKAKIDGTNDLTYFGAGLQPLFHFGAAQVGLRYEFLTSKTEGDAKSHSANSISVSPGYKLTPATLVRAEFRMDIASDSVFTTDKGANMSKTEPTVSAELNYTF